MHTRSSHSTIALPVLASALAVCLFAAGAARAALVVDVPGYTVKSVRISNLDSQDEGPALAAHPSQPVAYIAVDVTGGPPGSYQGYDTHQVWKLDFTSGLDTPTTSVFSAGAYRSTPGSGAGDDVLDSLFGSVGGIAVLADGSLLITDNTVDSQGRGDTIYRARDLNADGDALDMVDVAGTPTSETLILIAPIATPPGSGWGGFSGVQAEIDAAGNAFIITSDGGGDGEVLRIADPLTAPAINVSFTGLDFGSGLAFDSSGRLYAGNVDLNFFDFTSTVTVFRLDDADANGVIGSGEWEVVSYDQLFGLYDLAVAPDNAVFLTSGNEVRLLNTVTGTSTLFAHDPAWTFLADLVFLGGGSFAPFSGPGGTVLLVADPDSDGTITAITPGPAAGISDWGLFQ